MLTRDRLLLLRSGAKANIKDHDGRCPVHWATDNDTPDCISILLERVSGQTVDATDTAGMTPLMWAAFHNKVVALPVPGCSFSCLVISPDTPSSDGFVFSLFTATHLDLILFNVCFSQKMSRNY